MPAHLERLRRATEKAAREKAAAVKAASEAASAQRAAEMEARASSLRSSELGTFNAVEAALGVGVRPGGLGIDPSKRLLGRAGVARTRVNADSELADLQKTRRRVSTASDLCSVAVLAMGPH